ncbi:hypothetical protein [Tanticharoenia sakaeratensis]|uniref:hypothetical protein n=1 Tax=Tanticharoenia sakaeratensis TaxID=444053 RepID=UPI000B27385D|nr:hypothetical protein [Tanticharoenia sakaeratensis]GBQ24008.1 hypothetical protein AA103193_2603 [Tanticharoenia sakaeratensis NBRC 103193]
MPQKTAVLFKCHSWDDTIDRSYARCKMHASRSDIFILYDNSRGTCEIPEDLQRSERVFFTPYSDIEALGIAWGSERDNLGGYWYNGDYHQNLFILKHPEYDYISSVENDVAIQNDIDAIFDDMAARQIDAVYKHVTSRNEWWSHTGNCEGYYDTTQHIHKGLFCISFFSRTAAMLIARRRFEMSHLKRTQRLETWPIGEAVMPHEMHLAGMKTEDLASYCDTLNQYDWAPCYLEREIDPASGRTFVHPVTELNRKFIVSNFIQDYRCLISVENLEHGSSRNRARIINDLEVYSRLYHHNHVYPHPAIREPILSDAREFLPREYCRLISGAYEIDVSTITTQLGTPQQQAARVVAPLPNYDIEINIFFEKERRLTLNVPGENTSVIFAARDRNVLHDLRVRAFDHYGKEIGVDPSYLVHNVGELAFFECQLPLGAENIILDQNTTKEVWLNFLRLIPTAS